MRIPATISDRLLRRTFREQKFDRAGFTVIDRNLPAFGLEARRNGARTVFVHVARQQGTANVVLGTTDILTAAETKETAILAIAAGKEERETGSLLADLAQNFQRRQGRCWQLFTPASKASRCRLIKRCLVPFRHHARRGDHCADIRRWFDTMSRVTGQVRGLLDIRSG